jgi:hypothetical protein
MCCTWISVNFHLELLLLCVSPCGAYYFGPWCVIIVAVCTAQCHLFVQIHEKLSFPWLGLPS